MDLQERIKEAFIGMKRVEVIDLVKEALSFDEDPLAVLKTCREAMEKIGKLFETGDFFLSELIYSAEVFKAVSAILEPYLVANRNEGKPTGTIVFGTPKGDIHDLGKNIVITMMRAQGFEVHDLGIDVPAESFIEEITRSRAPILALSALITPAFESMKKTIDLLNRKGLREKTFVIIGGGVTTEFARKEMGADAQTLDPTEAIYLCAKYLNETDQY